jgi:hypothetical protein
MSPEYLARQYLIDQGVVESGNMRDYMNRKGVSAALQNERDHLTKLNEKIDTLTYDTKTKKIELPNLKEPKVVDKANEEITKLVDEKKNALLKEYNNNNNNNSETPKEDYETFFKKKLTENYKEQSADNQDLYKEINKPPPKIDDYKLSESFDKTTPGIFNFDPNLPDQAKTVLAATTTAGLGFDNYQEDEDSEDDTEGPEGEESGDNISDNLAGKESEVHYLRGGRRKNMSQKKYNKKSKMKKNLLKLKSLKKNYRKSIKKINKYIY